MKRAAFPILVLLAAAIAFTGFRIKAQDMAQRLRTKAAMAQAGVNSWVESGRDPSAVLDLMRQVKPALDAGNAPKAEALLDRAIAMLTGDSAPSADPPLPVYSANEQSTDVYIRPEPVAIEGYDGSAMEPFISPDGHWLFFNNENDPRVNTDLRFAERIGVDSFRYRGELPDVNYQGLDAAPSLDSAGHFYFTTLRDYDRTRNSIYTGEFNGKTVLRLHPVPGDISPKTPGTVNMDVSISPDGQTLYISRAVVQPGAHAPKASDLMLARLENGAFTIDPESERTLKNINTEALEYAPAISADRLELYFTRGRLMAGSASDGAMLRIMVATRASGTDPFGEPKVLSAITGFVEAPSIPLDASELFFHKKVGGKFRIYRAVRNKK